VIPALVFNFARSQHWPGSRAGNGCYRYVISPTIAKLLPNRHGLTRGSVWFALLAGVVVAIGVIVVLWVVNDRAQKHLQLMIENAARLNQLLIRQDIGNRISALERLAQRWTATGGTPRLVWEADAARYVADMPGFQAIEWADSSFQIRWVVPLAGNELVEDLDITQEKEAGVAVRATQKSGRATLSEPFELAQGGLGITVYVPVYRNAQFDGVIVGVLNLETWLKTVIGVAQGADHHARIFLQGHEVYRSDGSDEAVENSRMERSEFSDRGLTWTILVAPNADFLSTGYADSSKIVLMVGLLLSMLVAVVVYLASIARNRSYQIQEAASQLDTLIQSLPGMAYRCTGRQDRAMEFVSDGCLVLSGYSRREFEEHEVLWGDLIHADDRSEVSRQVRRAAASTGIFEFEYRILNRAGDERWMWERGCAVARGENGNIRLEGFVSDLTDQRAAESEARQHREYLAHADRLNMLGEMATGIAHEINQPLTAITLFAQAGGRLLRAGKKDRLLEIFDKLNKHAHRASAVIERMQTMVRSQERTKEVTDCNVLVEDVSKLAEAEAAIRDMSVELELTATLPAVAVDTVQIQQVALNLLRNGMESMQSTDARNGSSIRLRTSLREDGDIQVSVTDSGSGVTAEVAKKLFVPFSTTKKSGMGMGLSISRAIIIAHGGNLDFFNNETCGATFFFTLPQASRENGSG